jgi:hypothetical protein
MLFVDASENDVTVVLCPERVIFVKKTDCSPHVVTVVGPPSIGTSYLDKPYGLWPDQGDWRKDNLPNGR